MIGEAEWVSVLLAIMRATAFVYSAPILSYNGMPPLIRFWVVVLFTYVAWASGGFSVGESYEISQLALLTVSNLAIGYLIGTIISIVFNFLAFGGFIVASSAGLGFAAMADPVNGTQSTSVSNFYNAVGSLLLVSSGGLISFIEILAQSYRIFPMQIVKVDGLSFDYIADVFNYFGKLSLLVALPVLLVALLMNIAFGIMSKSSPSMNVLSVGLPLGIVVSVLTLYLSIESVPMLVARMLDDIPGLIFGGAHGR